MPPGSVLVLEDGSPSAEFNAFCSDHAVSSTRKLAGVRKPVVYLELKEDTRDAFLDQCARLAGPEICMHAFVYDSAGVMLVSVFDVGDDAYVRRDLPQETLDALSATVRPPKAPNPGMRALVALAITSWASVAWFERLGEWGRIGWGASWLVLVALSVGWVVTGAIAWRWRLGSWPSTFRIVLWLLAGVVVATFCLFSLPWLMES